MNTTPRFENFPIIILLLLSINIFSCKNCYTCSDECYQCENINNGKVICGSSIASKLDFENIKKDFFMKAEYKCKKLPPQNIRSFCDKDEYLKILVEDSLCNCE